MTIGAMAVLGSLRRGDHRPKLALVADRPGPYAKRATMTGRREVFFQDGREDALNSTAKARRPAQKAVCPPSRRVASNEKGKARRRGGRSVPRSDPVWAPS